MNIISPKEWDQRPPGMIRSILGVSGVGVLFALIVFLGT